MLSPPCSGIGALFNIVCLALCFIFPAKNRPTNTTSSNVGFFKRFSSLKGRNMSEVEQDTEVAGADVSKKDVGAATNIVADSISRCNAWSQH